MKQHPNEKDCPNCGQPMAWKNLEKERCLKCDPFPEDSPSQALVPCCSAPTHGVPEGWKLVPIEPDQWMRAQGEEGMDDCSVTEVWRRMLNAAPKAENHPSGEWDGSTARPGVGQACFLSTETADWQWARITYISDYGVVADVGGGVEAFISCTKLPEFRPLSDPPKHNTPEGAGS